MFKALSDWWNGNSAATQQPAALASSTAAITTAFNTSASEVSPLDKLIDELNAQIAKCEENKKAWQDYQEKLWKESAADIFVENPHVTTDNRNLFIIYWEDIKKLALELVTPENEEIKAIFLQMERHINDLKSNYDSEKNNPLAQCNTAIEIQEDLIELLQTFIDHMKRAEDHKEGMIHVIKNVADTVAKLSLGIILPQVDLERIDKAVERDLATEIADDEQVASAERWVNEMSAVVSPFQTHFSSSR